MTISPKLYQPCSYKGRIHLPSHKFQQIKFMEKLPLEQRTRPIEQYLDRQAGANNELGDLRTKNINYFYSRLNTNPNAGLTDAQAIKNQELYGKNEQEKRRLKTFCEMFLGALDDEMLKILMVAAVISIVVQGIYSEDRSTFWVEGVAILFAVAICSIVAAVNDYQKQKQFQELNELSERSNKYDVIRENKSKEVFKEDIVVGDIFVVKGGLEIPVDGLVVEARDVILDESSMTGESHEVYKNTIDKCLNHGTVGKDSPSPVIISGSKIVSGEGKMVVLVVGKENRMGKLSEMIQEEEEDDRTPLQEKLDELASKIGMFGLYSALALFVALAIRLLISEIIPNGWQTHKHLGDLLQYLILAVVIVVVAVPEGLPLAVTLSLAFSVKQMLDENNLVRRLASCETMGSAHVICTDKTGTLTMNDMFVVEIWNGKSHTGQGFERRSVDVHARAEDYRQMIFQAIANNSSAVLVPRPKGSPTQIALLRYADQINARKNLAAERQKYSQKYFLRLPFNSDRKRISTGVTINNQHFLFLSGGSELVIQACADMYDVTNQGVGFSPIDRGLVNAEIQRMTRKGLRVLAIAVKRLQKPQSSQNLPKDKFGISPLETSGFRLLLLAGIQDLPRPESKGAISQCHRAGVVVIMVTGDNSLTARSIANDLGITRADDNTPGLCMEGPEFQRTVSELGTKQFHKKIKNLKVLSRSRPQHKFKLVEGLKSINNVVAVTGDGTNDAPALIKADVGMAMGIAGTQIAKNAADILILDDNFNSIVRSLVWGRNIYDSVRKFLQFQLTVNLVACILSVISAALIRQSVLSAVQMLWVNLIMDSLASLALATEPPNTEELLNRKPVNRSDSLITKRMLKHVLVQSVFQIIVLLVLIFKGHQFLPEYPDQFDALIGNDLSAKYNNGGTTMATGCYYPLFGGDSYERSFQKYHIYSRHFTFIFNTFVLMQVVNFFNCRKIYDEIALWTGILNNKIYLLILAFIVLFQWIIVTYISIFFKAYNYNGLTIQQWLIGWAIALCGIPLSLLTRLIPYGKEENPVQPSDDNYLQITMQEHSGAHEKTIKTHHTIPKQHQDYEGLNERE